MITCQADQTGDNQEWYIEKLDGALDDVLLIDYAPSSNTGNDYADDECLDVAGWASQPQ